MTSSSSSLTTAAAAAIFASSLLIYSSLHRSSSSSPICACCFCSRTSTKEASPQLSLSHFFPTPVRAAAQASKSSSENDNDKEYIENRGRGRTSFSGLVELGLNEDGSSKGGSSNSLSTQLQRVRVQSSGDVGWGHFNDSFDDDDDDDKNEDIADDQNTPTQQKPRMRVSISGSDKFNQHSNNNINKNGAPSSPGRIPRSTPNHFNKIRASFNSRIMPSRVILIRHGQSEGNANR